MKVKDLKIYLEPLDDDLDVILAKDSEGNEFSLLADIETGFFDEEEDFYAEDEEVNCICLWPVDY
jgi:hypothetical protein